VFSSRSRCTACRRCCACNVPAAGTFTVRVDKKKPKVVKGHDTGAVRGKDLDDVCLWVLQNYEVLYSLFKAVPGVDISDLKPLRRE
jgi:hypothetical protein